mgnify:CR=1 FL=1
MSSLAPGRHLLFTRPLTEGAEAWLPDWSGLVRRRAAQWGRLLATDPHIPGNQGTTFAGRAHVPAGETFPPVALFDSLAGLRLTFDPEVRTLVELVPAITTSDDTLAEARAFVEACGKTAVTVKDQAGFVVNALLIPYLLSAIRMLESGFATAEDIDAGMVQGWPAGAWQVGHSWVRSCWRQRRARAAEVLSAT